MEILNNKELDEFIFNHRDNGCIGVKGDLVDDKGLPLNIYYRDQVTGEEVKVKYNDL